MLTHQLISLGSGSTAEVVRHESDISCLGELRQSLGCWAAGGPICRGGLVTAGAADFSLGQQQARSAFHACSCCLMVLSDIGKDVLQVNIQPYSSRLGGNTINQLNECNAAVHAAAAAQRSSSSTVIHSNHPWQAAGQTDAAISNRSLVTLTHARWGD